jgi:lipoprotein-releasing system ATP-binding protein
LDPLTPTQPLIQLEKLTRIYCPGGVSGGIADGNSGGGAHGVEGSGEVVVFRELELAVYEGEQLAVMGESGAGKSTLLYLIAGLDRPTSGAVRFRGRNIALLSEAEVAGFRNREIGYVWQQHHLLAEFTCVENVMLPRLVRGENRAKALAAARERLEEVGLADRAHHRAGELSGGEQQRVAIARALVGDPSLLLADEPTGNLDERTGEKVFALLADLRRTRGLTSILVTHNQRFAESCGRVLRLEGGVLCSA